MNPDLLIHPSPLPFLVTISSFSMSMGLFLFGDEVTVFFSFNFINFITWLLWI